jgi:hypothetical protein
MSSPANGRQRRPIGASLSSAPGAVVSSSSAITVVENAAELSFGSEFDDVQILSNAQVAVILQMSAQNALVRDEELHDVYKKTQRYVERFNTMKNNEKEHQELVDELDNLQGLVCINSSDLFLFVHFVLVYVVKNIPALPGSVCLHETIMRALTFVSHRSPIKNNETNASESQRADHLSEGDRGCQFRGDGTARL